MDTPDVRTGPLARILAYARTTEGSRLIGIAVLILAAVVGLVLDSRPKKDPKESKEAKEPKESREREPTVVVHNHIRPERHVRAVKDDEGPPADPLPADKSNDPPPSEGEKVTV